MRIYIWLIALGLGSIALLRSVRTGRIAKAMGTLSSSIAAKSRSLDDSFSKMSRDQKIRSLNNQKIVAIAGGVLWSCFGLMINPVGGLIVCAASYRFVQTARKGIDEDIRKAELDEIFPASSLGSSSIGLESSSPVSYGGRN